MNSVRLVTRLRIVKEKLPLNFYLNKRSSYLPISSYYNNCVNWTEKTQSARNIQTNQLCFHQHQTSVSQSSWGQWYFSPHYPAILHMMISQISLCIFLFYSIFLSYFLTIMFPFFFNAPSLISYFNNCSSLWRLQVN